MCEIPVRLSQIDLISLFSKGKGEIPLVEYYFKMK